MYLEWPHKISDGVSITGVQVTVPSASTTLKADADDYKKRDAEALTMSVSAGILVS
jgi:hypothetical protein